MTTDNQLLLLVDDNDKFSGEYAERKSAHTGRGFHHRAFVVLLENKKGEVLLQRRKHKLWDKYWDTTAISHPLHLKDHDETCYTGAERALKSEMGISKVKLTNVGGFNYFVKYGKFCENEYCAIMTGSYDGLVNPDKNSVYEYKWIDKTKFIKECLNENKTYTPWAILTGKFLSSNNNFEKKLNDLREKIEKEIQKIFLAKKKETKSFSGLSPLLNAFYESNLGGKMLRGSLVCLGYELSGKRAGSKIITTAAAYEIMHASILAHDDIIDESSVRRGDKSLYQKLGGGHYGISQAISLADFGFFLAFELVLKTSFPAKDKDLALQFFTEVMQKTAFGELMDVELPAKIKKPAERDILTIMKLKTANYSISGPLILGAILAGAEREVLLDLAEFGENAGIAFQIQDDFLGVFGDEKKIGKSTLSDMKEGKYTLLYLHALKNASPEQKKLLKKHYGNSHINVLEAAQVKKIMKDAGGVAYSEKMLGRYIQNARKQIGNFQNKEVSEVLNQILEYITNRDY